MKRDTNRGAGFTLLEMLVVVVVLTVLIAILVPTLGHARRQSTRSACGARLHAIAAGLQAYASENEQILPWAAEVPSVNTSYMPLPQALAAQVPDPKAWQCPGDKLGYTRQADNKYFESYFAGEAISYEYRMGLGGLKVENIPARLRRPATAIWVLMDLDAFHAEKGQVPSKNLLYLDGHVANIKDTDVNNQALP